MGAARRTRWALGTAGGAVTVGIMLWMLATDSSPDRGGMGREGSKRAPTAKGVAASKAGAEGRRADRARRRSGRSGEESRSRVARGRDGRPVRIGDLRPAETSGQDLDVVISRRVITPDGIESAKESAWDAMGSKGRMEHASAAVEAVLAGADAGDPRARAAAAEELAAARADFFRTDRGRGRYAELEERIDG